MPIPTSPGRATSRYLRHADLGVEHIVGRFEDHSFRPHSHDAYLVGLTVAGREHLVQDGRAYVSRPGNLRLINPREVHAGGCRERHAWQYEALYLPVTLVRAAADTLGIAATAPRLGPPVLDDPPLAAHLARVFAVLHDEGDPPVREEALGGFVLSLLARAIEPRPSATCAEARAVRIARDHLDRNALSTVPLDELAHRAGVSKFHLLRLFKAASGLTPRQYQTQLRVEQAKRLLAAGEPPSEVATVCGFVDQSHLSRHFRPLVGLPPAAFARTALASARRPA